MNREPETTTLGFLAALAVWTLCLAAIIAWTFILSAAQP